MNCPTCGCDRPKSSVENCRSVFNTLRQMLDSHDLDCKGRECGITGIDKARQLIKQMDKADD